MASPEQKAELVFIPLPIIGHLVAAVETAKLIALRDQRLSITVLVMRFPLETKVEAYIKNPPAGGRIKFVELPQNDSDLAEFAKSPGKMVRTLVNTQINPVREAVAKIIDGSKPTRLAGFVVDMFCDAMIDVADEFGVPAYVYFTCSAAMLGLMVHLQKLKEDFNQDLTEYENSDAEISIPTYINPVPGRVFPSPVFDKERRFLDHVKVYEKAKGIVINTFLELEPHAIEALSENEKMPPLYPVGPVLHASEEGNKQKEKEIINWLDGQPDRSVVYLCFGSFGCFEGEQVKQVALALEQSGHGFLWSIRKPPPKDRFETPGEYENPAEVLPEGFIERIAGIGKVIGWAPQLAVLSHPAVGGFVSHCGWNSTLESIWCGVPMAAWPLYAEQQTNAFQLVKDLGLAVEIKMDYRKGGDVIVEAERIKRAIRELMDPDNEIRVKINDMKEKSRLARMETGSSHDFLGRLVDDVMGTI